MQCQRAEMKPGSDPHDLRHLTFDSLSARPVPFSSSLSLQRVAVAVVVVAAVVAVAAAIAMVAATVARALDAVAAVVLAEDAADVVALLAATKPTDDQE